MANFQQKRALLFVLLFPLILYIFGCGSKKMKIVARIGNDLISLEDYEKKFVKEKPLYAMKNVTFEEKKKFLDKMIDDRLQVQAAYQYGTDKIPEIKAMLDDKKREIVYVAILDKEVVYEIIKEEEIREYYEKSKFDIRARHILLSLPQSATAVEIDSTIAKANGIIDKIKAGTDFAELVEEYSQDLSTKSKSGDLGFIQWGRMERPILDAIFSMRKYELSAKPVRSSRGIHIFQVTDRRKKPKKPFEIEKEKIVQTTLFQKHRSEIMNLYSKFNKSIEQKNRVVYSDESIEKVVAFFTSFRGDSLYQYNFDKVPADFSWIDPEIRNLKMVTYNFGSMDIVGVFKYFDRQTPGKLTPFRNKVEVKQMVERIILIELTTELGLSDGIIEESPYKDRLKTQIDQILVSSFQKKEINDKIGTSEDMLKEYYTNNKTSFIEKARTEVQEILVKEESLAQSITSQAKAGQNFSELADKYNTRQATKSKNGNLGKLTENSYGIIGKTALQMDIGEIRGPLKTGKNFSIIKVLSRDDERIKTFDEAKNQVESKLRQELEKKYRSALQNRIKNQISVSIFPDILQQALEEYK